MLSLAKQEAYRRRYAAENPLWRPASHVYRDLVASHVSRAARVLDLGCGRGGVMEELHGRAGLAVGLDPDLASLLQHRIGRFARTGGLAESLPYRDGAFGLLCCSWTLEHLADPAGALAEVARVLAPGGHFLFLTPNRRHPLLLLNRLLSWTGGRLVGRLYGRAQVDTFAARYQANDPRRLPGLLRDAGLEPIALTAVGDPTYLAFNELLYRLACLLERLTPRDRRVHLVGEARRV